MEVYLQRAIEQVVVGGRYVKEGMVQSAIGRFPADGFTVLDREAVVSFGSQAEKDACIAELSARWLRALDRPDPPSWWKTSPDRLGDECDALAVSREGEILAIEVKPHTAADTDIAWSVLQAGMYADLFQRWADQAGDSALAVLRGMAEQRHQIGLAPEAQFKLASPVRVVPVVAIDWRTRDSAVHKLNEVLSTLRSAHLADDMSVHRVNLVGRLDPIE